MKTVLKNYSALDVYTAPQCRVCAVALESYIAQTSPGSIPDDEIDDEEDDD